MEVFSVKNTLLCAGENAVDLIPSFSYQTNESDKLTLILLQSCTIKSERLVLILSILRDFTETPSIFPGVPMHFYSGGNELRKCMIAPNIAVPIATQPH